MGEALIYLVCQDPGLWDKRDAMYKDSSYKEAKWKEIVEILHLNKEDVIKKWKSLRDTYVWHVEVSWHHVLHWYNTTKAKVCTNLFNRQLCMILIRSIQEK